MAEEEEGVDGMKIRICVGVKLQEESILVANCS